MRNTWNAYTHFGAVPGRSEVTVTRTAEVTPDETSACDVVIRALAKEAKLYDQISTSLEQTTLLGLRAQSADLNFDKWLLDSGACHHMIGTKWIAPIQDKVRRTNSPVFLAGISGVIRVDHEVDIWIKQLNTALTVYVLEGELCPVLSEGRLYIDMGFDIRWPAFSTNPVLRRPDGVEQALVVEYYTPNLETGGNIKAGFAGAARAYYRPADTDETWAAPAQDTSDEHTRLPATPGVAIAKAKPKAKAKQNTVTDTGGGMELLMEEPAAVGPTDPATVADTTGDDSIPPPPPTPPPAYVEITEDDLCEHERPQATVMTKRKGEVNTLRHLMTHSVFNPYCEACVLANQNRKANRRRQQTNIIKPKKFGTWTMDHFHGRDKKLTQGITGTKSGLVVYDLGTDFGYMYALT